MLKIEILRQSSFDVFGDVIEANALSEQFDINDGNTKRFHDLAKLDLGRSNGRASVNIFRSRPLALPFKIEKMERHPLSSQAFYPLSSNPYVVAVAPPGNFEPSQLKIFLAKAGQGVNYKPGTWHHYSFALNEESDFIVIDRIANDNNCEEIFLSEVIGNDNLPVVTKALIDQALLEDCS